MRSPSGRRPDRGLGGARARPRSTAVERRPGPEGHGPGARSSSIEPATARPLHAAADLAALDASTGVTVPAGEIVFLPSLPLRIDQVEAEVGETPPAGFVWVSGARLAVDSSIDAVDADLVRVGQEVTIEVPGVDRTFTGTIAEVADETPARTA